jgi:hypothetical protein
MNLSEDLLENAVQTEPGLSDNREGYAMDHEEMVGGDNEDMFENDLDRLSRDANPGTIVTGAFLHDPESSNDGWRERHAALFAELEAAHNEAANEKDLPVPHIKYRSTFGVEILNSWLNEIRPFRIYFLMARAGITNPINLSDPSLCP